MPEPEELMPRQPDRRQAPRRADDAAMHYTAQLLIMAALAVVDDSPGDLTPPLTTWDRLVKAVEQYRRAESVAVPS